jgi:hypothetical protein
MLQEVVPIQPEPRGQFSGGADTVVVFPVGFMAGLLMFKVKSRWCRTCGNTLRCVDCLTWSASAHARGGAVDATVFIRDQGHSTPSRTRIALRRFRGWAAYLFSYSRYENK